MVMNCVVVGCSVGVSFEVEAGVVPHCYQAAVGYRKFTQYHPLPMTVSNMLSGIF